MTQRPVLMGTGRRTRLETALGRPGGRAPCRLLTDSGSQFPEWRQRRGAEVPRAAGPPSAAGPLLGRVRLTTPGQQLTSDSHSAQQDSAHATPVSSAAADRSHRPLSRHGPAGRDADHLSPAASLGQLAPLATAGRRSPLGRPRPAPAAGRGPLASTTRRRRRRASLHLSKMKNRLAGGRTVRRGAAGREAAPLTGVHNRRSRGRGGAGGQAGEAGEAG